MEAIITISAFLVLIGIVVTIHECGHFFSAKACGMKILEFSLGLGPKIYQRKIGTDGLLFTIRLLPLGGFVKPLDEHAVTLEEWNALSEQEKKRSFENSPRWKKVIMVAGGPFSNFVLAFVIYLFAVTIIGEKSLPPIVGEILPSSIAEKSGLNTGDHIQEINGKSISTLNEANSIITNAVIKGDKVQVLTQRDSAHELDFGKINLHELKDDIGKLTGMYFQGPIGDIQIKKIDEGGVAEKYGFQVNDIITSIGGLKTQDLNKVLRKVRQSPGDTVTIEYIREGKKYIKNVTLDSSYKAGIYIGKLNVMLDTPNTSQYTTVKQNILQGTISAFDRVVNSTWTTVVSIKKLITGEISTKAISGPLTIADYSGKSAKNGLYTYLIVMASISIGVGVFNLLPIPVLDGGHLTQYFIEFVRQKDFTSAQRNKFQFVGIIMMIGVFTLAFVNDMTKYLGFLG